MSLWFYLFLLITTDCILLTLSASRSASTADSDSSEEECCSKSSKRIPRRLNTAIEKHREELIESISPTNIEEENKEGENLQPEREEKIKFRKMKIFEDATRLLTRNIRNAMAWMSSADSNVGLVNNLQSNY